MDISRFPPSVQNILTRLLSTFDLNLPGGLVISPNIVQAILVVVLLFLLIYTLGHLRHTYLDWSIKGILPGLSFGFILAIIIEGLLLVGGKTILTETLGWKNAPKPISNALDAGRQGLTNVLGVSSTIPSSSAKDAPTIQSINNDIKNLSKSDQVKLHELICDVK